MVFYCRCFSFLLEEEDDEEEESQHESKTRNRSSATEYHSAYSEFNQSQSHLIKSTQVSETLRLPQQRSNLRVFTSAELEAATANYCRALMIGEDEFWSVYTGVIMSLEHPFNEIQVAVKRPRLTLQDHIDLETEIKVLIGEVEHPNLVKLIGYRKVYKDRHILVYEYMANGSVRDHLSLLPPLFMADRSVRDRLSSQTSLSWNMRVKVAQDVARGLAYLHEELGAQIVLRYFKPSSILLDDQWNAKLSDFGFAQLHPRKRPMWRVPGTGKYTAPESIKEGIHTSKSDVWSYGVFLYDLITGTGQLPIKRNNLKLLKWGNLYLGSKKLRQIVDPRLDNYHLKSVQKLCIIANKCLSKNPKSRPKMSEVLEMVNQLIMVPLLATSPTSPQVPQVAIDPNNTIVGPTQGERNNKRACVPYIRPSKLLTSCCKKGCCVSLQ